MAKNDELDAAILRGDSATCFELGRVLSEDERRALAPAVIARYREIQDERDPDKAFSRPKGYLERARAALIALYATAPLKEIQKHDRGFAFGDPIYDMLAARRPAWLAQWVDWTVERHSARWFVVRRLVREGLVTRPASDLYYLGIFSQADVRATLENDPELLDHEVWRLFEIEGRPDASFAQRDKYALPAYRWAPTLLALAQENQIDRRRLLAASVAALQRGFKQFQSAWFTGFHESLEPSIEERETLAREYLHLLASPIPPTVAFALRALQRLEEAARLDAESLLESVPPALYAREKGSAESALKLLESIASRRPELRERTAAVAFLAVEHSDVTVQKRALNIIENYGEPALLSERLKAAATLVAPSLRNRLPGTAALPAKPPQATPDPRLKSIPAKWRKLAGIRADGSLESLDLNQPGIPRLHRGNQIVPIDKVDELVPAFLRVLEAEGPADEIERILSAVSRLCAERPGGFERLVSPLRKRAQGLTKRQWPRTPALYLAAIARAWLGQSEWSIKERADDADGFVTRRLEALANRVRQGLCQPLLSAPTHAGGSIDPAVLKKRLRHAGETDQFDLELAQMRAAECSAAWLRKPLYEEAMIRWASTFAPSRREEWFHTGTLVILRNIDWRQAQWGNKAYLESLFEPDTALGEEGLRLLVLGLAAKENGEGTLATDALIAVIADGRLETSCLAAALQKATKDDGIKRPRVAKRLAQASQASPLHAAAIQAALAEIFRVSNAKPLKQLFDDLSADCGRCDLNRERLRVRLNRAERWHNQGEPEPASTAP